MYPWDNCGKEVDYNGMYNYGTDQDCYQLWIGRVGERLYTYKYDYTDTSVNYTRTKFICQVVKQRRKEMRPIYILY